MLHFLQIQFCIIKTFAFFAIPKPANGPALVFFHLNNFLFSGKTPNKMAKKNAEKSFRFSEQFVKRIKKVVPANISLVDEMAGVLDISNDSAYRRLRGETAITLDEAMLLCQHFKIAL
ncbi:MAG: hypothetical protein EBT92_18430, partial [Planctomycetes bacterium]|nr:hypothetical protein [Planctomycetota bacterium]